MTKPDKHHQTIVIGAGQAGLALGYYLKQQGHNFIILDGNARVGDSWRQRWDSLHLFTPAYFDGLPGMAFPAPAHTFPSKDEMADFLAQYAAHFDLPVQMETRVLRLGREDGRFVLRTQDRRYTADNVVLAMSNWQKPRVPDFASTLNPDIVQLNANQYLNPAQVQPGAVLVVGAGNSGAEIALELSRTHSTWLSGRHPGHIPFRIETFLARHLLIRLVIGVFYHHVLTLNSPIGRRMRSKLISSGMPLIRIKPQDIEAAGIKVVPRTSAVRDGLPVLEDGQVLDVANVVWCTGYEPGLSWMDIEGFEAETDVPPRGVVRSVPGLYFVGRNFQYAASSETIYGMQRDAAYIARQITKRSAYPANAAPIPTSKPHIA